MFVRCGSPVRTGSAGSGFGFQLSVHAERGSSPERRGVREHRSICSRDARVRERDGWRV